MLKSLIELLYNLSKSHKLIKSFKYALPDKEAGIPYDKYPLVFVEQPIITNYMMTQSGIIHYKVNIDFTATKQNLENYNVKQPTVIDIQSLMENVAYNFLSKIQNMYKDDNDESEWNVVDYSILTLTKWFDDNADGVRLSLTLSNKNPINFCDTDNHFDPDKEFNTDNILPDIDLNNPESCTDTFEYKLPDFKL